MELTGLDASVADPVTRFQLVAAAKVSRAGDRARLLTWGRVSFGKKAFDARFSVCWRGVSMARGNRVIGLILSVRDGRIAAIGDPERRGVPRARGCPGKVVALGSSICTPTPISRFWLTARGKHGPPGRN